MVEYASRILAAIEEYSAYASKNFNVVVQSLKIRRAISVHLWNGNDGLLQQIQGISKTTCYSLHLGGISTFDTVLKTSEDIIEKAANRSPPFGSHLKKACAKILNSRLKLSATIETAPADGTPSSLICTLERPISVEPLIVADLSENASAVTYSLIAYTDRPNGGIMLKENIAGPAAFKVPIPPHFGKITLKLVASIVGLDDTIILEGNDKTAPSSLFAQNGGGLKSASGKIRHLDQKNRAVVNSKVAGRGSLIEGPRIQQKQVPSVASEPTGKGERQCLYQSRLQHGFSNQTSVTPSPKPPSANATAAMSRNASAQCPNAEKAPSVRLLPQNGPNGAVAPITTHRNGSHITCHRSTLAFAETQDIVAVQASQRGYLWKPTQGSRLCRDVFPRSIHQSEASGSRQSQNAGTYERSPPSTGWESSLRSEVPKRSFEQSRDDRQYSSDVTSSWKRVKGRHQKHQQRAFVHKALNPFSHFQHDPNYSDKYLENLSAQSRSPKDNIIPESALAQNHRASHFHALRMQSQRPSRFCGRQPSQSGFSERCMSTQELLAQKADEHNMHATVSMRHGSLPWGANSRSHSWCPEEVQPWGASAQSHQHDYPYHPDAGGRWNSQGTSKTNGDLNGRGDEVNRHWEFEKQNLAGLADQGFDYCLGSTWQHSDSTSGAQAVTSRNEHRGPYRDCDEPLRQNSWDNSTVNDGHESAYFY